MAKATWMDTPEKYIYRTSTGTLITPYKSYYSNALESRYSIKRRGTAYPVPFSGFYLSKEHVFVCPPDLSEEMLKTLLPEYQFVQLPVNPAKDCYPFVMKDIELRPQQEEFLLETKECIYRGHRRIFCNMQTGYGKTIAVIHMIQFHQKKTVLITYMDRLMNQWDEVFNKMTDLPSDRILSAKGSKTLENMRENPFEYNSYDIFMISHELLSSYGKNYGYHKISELFQNLGIGVKVYDEAHHSIRSMIAIDAFTNVQYTYYLTADYNQSNDSKMLRYRNIFKGVPILPRVMKGEKYITCISMNYDSHPELMDKLSVMSSDGFRNLNYMKYEFDRPYVYRCVKEMLDKLFGSDRFDIGGRIIIFTSFIENLLKLYTFLVETYGDRYGRIGKYYGEMEDEEKEYEKQHSRILVATYGSFGVGIDAENIQCVISCDMISRIQANQAAGRVRPSSDPNKYALFVSLYDDGFDYCKSARSRINKYLAEGKGRHFINYWIQD